MSKLLSKELLDNSQGKYIVQVGFTFIELTEVRKAVLAMLKEQNRIKKDPNMTAQAHERAGYRSQQLQFVIKGLQEAHVVIKSATIAREEGRFKKRKITKKLSRKKTING